jgi:hypothetical protein
MSLKVGQSAAASMFSAGMTCRSFEPGLCAYAFRPDEVDAVIGGRS